MAPVLGVEGGGSHSHAVVVDPSGLLLGVGANDDPANWEDVGIEAAGAAIRSCVREALDAAGVRAEQVGASLFALAGVDFPMDEQRLGGIPAGIGLHEPFRVSNDAFAALRAGTDQQIGVVAVAGTGSVVAGRNGAGEEFRTLGAGPMLGDTGSVSEVSEAAVTAVANAFTGRGPETALTALLCERAGAASVVEFLEGASRGRIDPSRFAPEVGRAADDDDEAALAILVDAGLALGETVGHVIRRLGLADEAFDLVLAGGMFRGDRSLFRQAVEWAVRTVAPEARPRRLDHPPVVGAALLAMELAGVATGPDVQASLAEAVSSALGHKG